MRRLPYPAHALPDAAREDSHAAKLHCDHRSADGPGRRTPRRGYGAIRVAPGRPGRRIAALGYEVQDLGNVHGGAA